MGNARGDGAVIDPTANVLGLVAAEARRQDDLREAENRLTDEKTASLRRAVESVQKEVALRDSFAERMIIAEAARTDALRELDRMELRTATERQQEQVSTLDRATRTMADTLRTERENMARTLAEQRESSRKEFDARLSAIEKAQSVVAGKTTGIGLSWSVLVTVVLALIAMLGLYLKTK